MHEVNEDMEDVQSTHGDQVNGTESRLIRRLRSELETARLSLRRRSVRVETKLKILRAR